MGLKRVFAHRRRPETDPAPLECCSGEHGFCNRDDDVVAPVCAGDAWMKERWRPRDFDLPRGGGRGFRRTADGPTFFTEDGHDIQAAGVRRRFQRGSAMFCMVYRPLADWRYWHRRNGQGHEMRAQSEDRPPAVGHRACLEGGGEGCPVRSARVAAWPAPAEIPARDAQPRSSGMLSGASCTAALS